MKKTVHNIIMPAQYLTMDRAKKDIIMTKKMGYDELTYSHEPLVGPYLCVDMKDFDDEGNELPVPADER